MRNIFLLSLFLFACSGYDRENFRMEVGKKYDLEKWPDSAYVDTLDRYFENEYVKQPTKKKAEITMSMDNKKTMSLPGKSPKAPPEKKSQNANVSEFSPEKFLDALYKLTENPGSNEFGKRHKAKDGETLDALLLRVYGSQAKKVPKSISESMIKKLNPSADFSSLSEKDMVLLPVVK